MEDKPGFGFRPYEPELVGYYLRNKNLGNNRLVEGAISEVNNIYSLDPWKLRFESKMKSRDHFWYFFCRNENVERQSRQTSSGFWKITGVSGKVEDRWGLYGVSGEIGSKRVLVFKQEKNAKGIKSDWVIHEFLYTLLPENQRTYVVCRLEYKGDDKNILLENATDPNPTFVANMTTSLGSVVDQPVQANTGVFSEFDSANQDQWFPGDLDVPQSVQGNFSEYDFANQDQWFAGDFNTQQLAPYSVPYGDESDMIWNYVVEENRDFLVDERTFMQNFSDYRPKNPVTGVLADDSSDNDTDSMIGRDTWSSTGSSNGPYPTPIDDILSLSTIEPLHNYEAQEQPKQLKLQLQGKEKVINKQKSECERKMAEDSIKKTPSANTVKQNWIVLEMSRRNSQWIYLRNMIIGFLLFISIIGWIILIG